MIEAPVPLHRNLNFARHFKAARKRYGLSQPAAADRWAVPVRALRNWEQGIRTPSGHTIIRLLPILFPGILNEKKLVVDSNNTTRARKAAARKRQA